MTQPGQPDAGISTSVVYFATQLYPIAAGRSSGFGGAETELWNVAQRLGQCAGLDVRVLTLTDEVAGPERYGNVTLHPVEPSEKLTYQDPVLKRRRAIVKYYVNLYRRLKAQRADIYVTKLASSEASTVWLASRAAKGKFVIRIEHDWETNLRDLQGIIFRGSWFWSRAFLYCLKRADLVVAQTYKQAMELERNYGVKSVLIPNGHLIPADSEVDKDAAARDSVLWVARVHPMKRPHLFLDLAEKHRDYKFTMIMAPHPEHTQLFEECRARAAQLQNVEFVPGVAPAEVNKFYQRARAFVLTSDAEGFSNVIIEALKNGTPAVSLGHNPNDLLAIVTDSETAAPSAGFFTSDSLETSSQMLVRMFADETFWRECHQKARELAVEAFGIENVVKQYCDEFERLMAHP